MSKLKAVLEKFNRIEGVEGSLICGHDGIVVETALAARFNADELAALGSSVHLAVMNAIEDFGFGRTTKFQIDANRGVLVVVDLGRGLFIAMVATGVDTASLNVELFQTANEIKKHVNLG